jgi:hypothetical protein
MTFCACVMTALSLMAQAILLNVTSHDVRVYACSDFGMSGWILMNFLVDIMPFESN